MIGHPNLYCWIRCEGNMLDVKGNANVTVQTGTESASCYTTGKHGLANDNNALVNYRWTPPSSVATDTSIWSLAFWLRLGVRASTPQYDPISMYVNNPVLRTEANYPNAGDFRFYLPGYGVYPQCNIPDTSWHHFVLTKNAKTTNGTKLYMDSVLQAQATYPAHSTATNVSALRSLTGGQTSEYPLNGGLDEIMFFENYILTPEDIKRIMGLNNILGRT